MFLKLARENKLKIRTEGDAITTDEFQTLLEEEKKGNPTKRDVKLYK